VELEVVLSQSGAKVYVIEVDAGEPQGHVSRFLRDALVAEMQKPLVASNSKDPCSRVRDRVNCCVPSSATEYTKPGNSFTSTEGVGA
jgi:hypothetical protein